MLCCVVLCCVVLCCVVLCCVVLCCVALRCVVLCCVVLCCVVVLCCDVSCCQIVSYFRSLFQITSVLCGAIKSLLYCIETNKTKYLHLNESELYIQRQ